MQEKMGRNKDLSEFDKGQIVMARRLVKSISKMLWLMGFSQSEVVRICQQWSEEGQTTNRLQVVGCLRLMNAGGQQADPSGWSQQTVNCGTSHKKYE